MTAPPRPSATAIVLAAGGGSRFGGRKLLTELGGRPILQLVLDAVAMAGPRDVVVVLGEDAEALETAIEWHGERRVRNPDPSRGLASSVQIGLAAVPPESAGALLLLGDQPAVPVAAIRSVLEAAGRSTRPVVVASFLDGSARNPVFVRRDAFGLADELRGDRGLGPVLAVHPELVEEVTVPGSNPDIDRPVDLAAAAAARWAARVRADREQVERYREVPDGRDFYAPVRSIFRDDPDRTDDPVLDALRELVVPGETWLDIGAGAGRFALPLARVAREVIALDPSESMLEALDQDARANGIANVRAVLGRWPPDPDAGDGTAGLGPMPFADVAFIAHVGYDIEAILPFVEAMEAAARRLCVAVLMEVHPGSVAAPLWPPVHGEERVILPGVNELIELLRLRGRRPSVQRLPRKARQFGSREDLDGVVRRQLWVAEGSAKDAVLLAALEPLVVRDEAGWMLGVERIGDVGLVTWRPDGG